MKSDPKDVVILAVGTKVFKRSNKPFKSKNKVNTIASHGIAIETGNPCYFFEEDDSYVEVFRCIEYINV